MIALIVGCEIAFWVVLALGLLLRYPGRRPRAGLAVLWSVPLVDAVLLAATVIDLRGGAEPRPEHGLAACYLGFSLVLGHRTIRWADVRFAHRHAGGPPPPPRPAPGWGRFRHECRLFAEAVLACALSAVLLVACIALVGDRTRTGPLEMWLPNLVKVLLFWLVLGPLVDLPWTRRARRPDPAAGPDADAVSAPARRGPAARP